MTTRAEYTALAKEQLRSTFGLAQIGDNAKTRAVDAAVDVVLPLFADADLPVIESPDGLDSGTMAALQAKVEAYLAEFEDVPGLKQIEHALFVSATDEIINWLEAAQ